MSDELAFSWGNLPDDLIGLILEIRRNFKRNAQRLIASLTRGRRVRRILARARAVTPNRPLRNVPMSLQAIVNNSTF